MNFSKKTAISIMAAFTMVMSVFGAFSVVNAASVSDTNEQEIKASTASVVYTVEPKDNLEAYKIPKESVSIASDDFAMANITEEADVYAEASADSAVAGKIYPTTSMTVLSTEGEWTQIQTGNLTGFVPSSSLVFGEAGRVLMNAKCPKAVVIETDTELYAANDAASEVTGTATSGEIFDVKAQLSGWYQLNDSDGNVVSAESDFYVPADRLRAEAQTQQGKTTEELEAEAKAAEEAAAAAAAAEEAAKQAEQASSQVAASNGGTTVTQGAAVSASTDDVDLLAHLLYCEAGSGYEDCLAVGAVVMNRVKSPSFPNNIYDVIYQSGQFSPTWNGAMDRAYATGVPQSCYDAANAAIGGASNIGGLLYFRQGTNGTIVIGDNAFR